MEKHHKRDRRKETVETLDKFEMKDRKRKNWTTHKKEKGGHTQKGKNHQLHQVKQNCSINIESSNILLPLAALL
jgi:hypothetical protein